MWPRSLIPKNNLCHYFSIQAIYPRVKIREGEKKNPKSPKKSPLMQHMFSIFGISSAPKGRRSDFTSCPLELITLLRINKDGSHGCFFPLICFIDCYGFVIAPHVHACSYTVSCVAQSRRESWIFGVFCSISIIIKISLPFPCCLPLYSLCIIFSIGVKPNWLHPSVE